MTEHETLFGYHGRMLHVDASAGQGRWRPLAADVLHRYIGGAGLGAHLMLQAAESGKDANGLPWGPPLAPNSPLLFVFSPLVSSPLTTSAKFAVVCHSPLTHRISDSLASSGFAIAGKRAVGDALMITGRAAEPSILVIDNGAARLEPANGLWGQGIPAAERELRRRFPGFQSAVIGPGGEQQVPFATISHDGRHAGRGGSGAVLGSKHLKAIVVRGDMRCEWADPSGLSEYAKQLSKRSFGPATAKYREIGTAANLLAFNRMHTLPTRNFQSGSFSEAAQIAPEALATARHHTRSSCAACTIGCEHIYSIQKSSSQEAGDSAGVRLEYESLFSLGSLCEVGDSGVILQAISQCDELGIDTISFGATVAFCMECAERSMLDEPWLRFGSGEALLRCLKELASGSVFGKLLATGSRAIAKRLGPEAERIAPHVKGLEIPGYAPQALHSMALGFAVGARGADHNRSGAYEVDYSDQVDRRDVRPDQVHLAVETERRAALMDSLILCKFIRGALDDFYAETAAMLRLTTGGDWNKRSLQLAAHRIVTAKKLFNMRAGWTRAEDTLPARMLEQPLTDDAESRLSANQLKRLVQAYYDLQQWDAEGLPTAAVLRRLGLTPGQGAESDEGGSATGREP